MRTNRKRYRRSHQYQKFGPLPFTTDLVPGCHIANEIQTFAVPNRPRVPACLHAPVKRTDCAVAFCCKTSVACQHQSFMRNCAFRAQTFNSTSPECCAFITDRKIGCKGRHLKCSLFVGCRICAIRSKWKNNGPHRASFRRT